MAALTRSSSSELDRGPGLAEGDVLPVSAMAAPSICGAGRPQSGSKAAP